jgi:hypothetical protein
MSIFFITWWFSFIHKKGTNWWHLYNSTPKKWWFEGVVSKQPAIRNYSQELKGCMAPVRPYHMVGKGCNLQETTGITIINLPIIGLNSGPWMHGSQCQLSNPERTGQQTQPNAVFHYFIAPTWVTSCRNHSAFSHSLSIFIKLILIFVNVGLVFFWHVVQQITGQIIVLFSLCQAS